MRGRIGWMRRSCGVGLLTMTNQQEQILRSLGRSLKRFPLNLDEEDSRIVEELKTRWSDLASVFFLLKVVNRSHLKFYRRLEDDCYFNRPAFETRRGSGRPSPGSIP